MKKSTIAGIIAGGVAAAAGAFVGGLFTGKSVQRKEDVKTAKTKIENSNKEVVTPSTPIEEN